MIIGSAGTLTLSAAVVITATDLTGLAWIQLRMVVMIAALNGHDALEPARRQDVPSLQAAMAPTTAPAAALPLTAGAIRVSSDRHPQPSIPLRKPRSSRTPTALSHRSISSAKRSSIRRRADPREDEPLAFDGRQAGRVDRPGRRARRPPAARPLCATPAAPTRSPCATPRGRLAGRARPPMPGGVSGTSDGTSGRARGSGIFRAYILSFRTRAAPNVVRPSRAWMRVFNDRRVHPVVTSPTSFRRTRASPTGSASRASTGPRIANTKT